MSLDPQELSELKERCITAHAHGFRIARAEHYVELLAADAGSVDMENIAPNSPSHILALVQGIEKGRGGESGKKTSKKTEAAKTEASVKVEDVPPKKDEPKVESKKDEPKVESKKSKDSIKATDDVSVADAVASAQESLEVLDTTAAKDAPKDAPKSKK